MGTTARLIAAALRDALRREIDQRRLFPWTAPIAAAGALVYFAEPREPSLAAAGVALAGCAGLAVILRRRGLFYLACALAVFWMGFASACLRTQRAAAPRLERPRIVSVTGYVEEVDPRRVGARLVLRLDRAEGMSPEERPFRIRVTTRRPVENKAGDFVAFKARLLPPASAARPGGYDFARDAFFARIGAVGNVLGAVHAATPPEQAPLELRAGAAIDRARNVIAARIVSQLTEPEASVAVAMVTGKRDLLDDATKDVIRQAGIFHIITISGVQMTLVAGSVFWIARLLFALSPSLALRRPIKAWAAGIAMAAAVGYDLATGSRIGAQRALIMTLVFLGSVVCGRRALSMRNLALAALTVLAIEPESILGASFQLSFSAVTALVAVQEARVARRAAAGQRAAHVVDPRDPLLRAIDRARRGPLALLFATACATCGTASFMAYDFHELSPYVLIGNPLTLAVIEFFAVPCALVGALLYPLGLDALVWKYLGTGIAFILWAAGKLAVAPDSSVPIPAFSPLALLCLAFGLLHVAIWRTPALRLSGAPWVVLGLAGALASSAPASANISPTGDLIAVRGADGRLGIFGRRLDGFVADQWLSADGDPRPSAEAFGAAAQGDRVRCDRRLCLVAAPEETIALVLDPGMFEAACATADVVVSPLSAPMRCDAALVLDRDRLRATGAVELRFRDAAIDTVTARAPHEDRPWSPAPQER